MQFKQNASIAKKARRIPKTKYMIETINEVIPRLEQQIIFLISNQHKPISQFYRTSNLKYFQCKQLD